MQVVLMVLFFMRSITSFENQLQSSKDPVANTIIEHPFETSESNLLPYGRLLEVRPVCKTYCDETGCDWTKYRACPWSSHEGDEGWADDDHSIGFQCCCFWRSSEHKPCGGTSEDDPTMFSSVVRDIQNFGNKLLRPVKKSRPKFGEFIVWFQDIEHSVWHKFMHITRFVEYEIAKQVLTAGFAEATLAEIAKTADFKWPEEFFKAFWKEVQTLVTEPHNLTALILLIFVAMIPKEWTIARIVCELFIKVVLLIVDAIIWEGFWQAAIIILVWQLYVDSCHPNSNLGAFLFKIWDINIHDSKPCKAAVQWQKWMDAVWGFFVSMIKKAYNFDKSVPNIVKKMKSKDWQSKEIEKAQDNFLNEMDPEAQKQLMDAKITDVADAKFDAMSNSVSDPESSILGETKYLHSKKTMRV